MQCERLQLDCLAPGEDVAMSTGERHSASRAEKRTSRTYRSCNRCRSSKLKCSGERPKCARCSSRSAVCVYDAESIPVWVRTIEDSSDNGRRSQEPARTTATDTEEELSEHMTETSRAESWLFSAELPSIPLRRRLAECYFAHHHPLRCFSFIHKPSFMQRIDEGKLSSKGEHALLHIVCAIGAKYFSFTLNHCPLANMLSLDSMHLMFPTFINNSHQSKYSLRGRNGPSEQHP